MAPLDFIFLMAGLEVSKRDADNLSGFLLLNFTGLPPKEQDLERANVESVGSDKRIMRPFHGCCLT